MTPNIENTRSDVAAAAHLPQTTEPVPQGDGDPGTPEAQTPGADPEPKAEVSEAPRVLAGLQIGRMVNYVMADGVIRPFLILCAGDGAGLVGGILFFKGREDAQRHPRGLVNDATGHLPACSVLLLSVAFDGETFAFGTWHFPSERAVVASSVDAHAFETMLLAAVERTIADEKNALVSLVNAKLAAQLQAVNETLDSFKGMVEGLVGGKAFRPTEFASLGEATEACGKDEFVHIATDGKITIQKEGEQTANTAAAGSGEVAAESGATPAAS